MTKHILISAVISSLCFSLGCVDSMRMPIVGVTPSSNPGFLTGSKLKEHCFKTGKHHSGICSGFILGVYNGVTLSEKNWTTTAPSVCPPENVTPSQLREIVVKFLNEENENLHKDAAELVWDSFILAFPCNK